MTTPDRAARLAIVLLPLLLAGCGPSGPSIEESDNCATHRAPTWEDLIDCKTQRPNDGKQ